MQLIQILRLPPSKVAANLAPEFSNELQVTTRWLRHPVTSFSPFFPGRKNPLGSVARFDPSGYHVVSASKKRPSRGPHMMSPRNSLTHQKCAETTGADAFTFIGTGQRTEPHVRLYAPESVALRGRTALLDFP